MSQRVLTLEEDGIIRVIYQGKAEYGHATEMLVKVAQMASERQIARLLFDCREADYQHYVAHAVQHAVEAASLGIKLTYRIALLGLTDNPMLQFFEDVGVKRGYMVRAFTEESDAKAWLRCAL